MAETIVLFLIFFFTELPVSPQAGGGVGTCKCDFYIILSTTVSFLDLNDAILFFTRSHFFMCAFPLFSTTIQPLSKRRDMRIMI